MASSKEYDCQYCGHTSKRSDAHKRHEENCSSKPPIANEELAKILDSTVEATTLQFQPVRKVRQPSLLGVEINVGEKAYDFLFLGAGIVQAKCNRFMKGFDVRVERKQDSYTEILSQLAEKYGASLFLPPEYALALSLSQDLGASIANRMLVPLKATDVEVKSYTKRLTKAVNEVDIAWN